MNALIHRTEEQKKRLCIRSLSKNEKIAENVCKFLKTAAENAEFAADQNYETLSASKKRL